MLGFKNLWGLGAGFQESVLGIREKERMKQIKEIWVVLMVAAAVFVVVVVVVEEEEE